MKASFTFSPANVDAEPTRTASRGLATARYQPPPPSGYPGDTPATNSRPATHSHSPFPVMPAIRGYAVDPHAPFGRDPATGLPLSDKSSTMAGLLRLFFGVFGVGRFYIDTTQIAVAQLLLGLFGLDL